MPSIKLTTVGGRAFPVARPTIWNSLPDNVISAPSLSTFHQRLKTFLFQASFPDIIIDPRQIIPLPSVDPEVILLLGPLKKYTIDWWLGMQVWRINSSRWWEHFKTAQNHQPGTPSSTLDNEAASTATNELT